MDTSDAAQKHTSTQPDAGPALARLMTVMARLRDPERGCEWDTVQTFETIAPYTIEEAYEVADAIQRGDLADLRDELGDLALQIVFHAQMAAEAGHFTLSEVLDGISDKMERRHPHIFGGDATGGHHRWEEIKAAERAEKPGDPSMLAGVALSLPALERASKLQKRAARTGFDWPDVDGPRAKILEELEEVAAADTDDAREEEVGDLLFAVVNLARFLKINPEEALRKANAKFEKRFRAIEAVPGFALMSLKQKEELWARTKQGLMAVPDLPRR
jgi:ATP diphosphatase